MEMWIALFLWKVHWRWQLCFLCCFVIPDVFNTWADWIWLSLLHRWTHGVVVSHISNALTNWRSLWVNSRKLQCRDLCTHPCDCEPVCFHCVMWCNETNKLLFPIYNTFQRDEEELKEGRGSNFDFARLLPLHRLFPCSQIWGAEVLKC